MSQTPAPPEISPQEMALQQAVEAIEQGKLAEARDMLTRLIKTDQQNATYWVWLSAAMETQKERLYCLQTAFQLDPMNVSARRGLTLLGVLAPDESVTPFPMSHPRPWVDRVKISNEPERPKGWRGLVANPVFRVAAILFLGVALIGGAIGGFALSGQFRPQPTARPRATAGPTTTMIPKNTQVGAPTGSLLSLLGATHTPTPIYAATPHGDAALDSYRGAIRAYEKGQWDMVGSLFLQVATAQPGAADPLYFVAESYRLGGRYEEALTAYEQALEVAPTFAPIYLGRGRTKLALNPALKVNTNAYRDILRDLDKAIELDRDGTFAEAHLERGLFKLRFDDQQGALIDLQNAAQINPASPIIQVALSKAEFALENYDAALQAAQTANELDVVLLDAYLMLGKAYRATGEMDKAVENLETYARYNATNPEVYWVLGTAYYDDGKYQDALEKLNRAIQLDRTSSEGYYWRGETKMALKQYQEAGQDFRQSLNYNQTSFKAGLGISRALIAQGDGNNAYANILSVVEKLVKTPAEKALMLYYRAKSLDMLGETVAALRDWKALLELDEELLSAEMLAEAEARVEASKFTATPNPQSLTPTMTPTPAPTRQPTTTPIPTNTRAPTGTP